MNEEQFILLVTKKLSGSIRPDELEEVETYVKENPEAEKVLQEVTRHWEQSAKLSLRYSPDTEGAWAKFMHQRSQTKQRVIRWNPWLSGVAAMLVMAIGLIYFFLSAETIRYETAAGETVQIVLPDGTQITLEEHSQLSLAEGFGEADRPVKLVGKAFFDVKRDEKRPFLISSGQTVTRVLGTSFVIDAPDAGPEVSVAVTSGKVSFSNGHDEILLTKGMKATHGNSSGKMALVAHPAIEQDGSIVFDNMLLTDVIHLLEGKYGVEIALASDKLQQCRFTATFKSPTLSEILKVMAITLDVQIEKTNNQYLIIGKGC